MGTIIPIVFSLVEEAIKIEPSVQAELVSIFSNPAATPADWEALRTKYAAKTYGEYVPDSQLTLPGTSTAPATA